MKITIKYLVGFLSCAFAASPCIYAQDGVAGEEDVIVLEEMAAEDVPIEESILATSRPITSVYGSERSILDTPRNVNIVSREQLDAISIRDVRDFSKLTSSSYTKTISARLTPESSRPLEPIFVVNGFARVDQRQRRVPVISIG